MTFKIIMYSPDYLLEAGLASGHLINGLETSIYIIIAFFLTRIQPGFASSVNAPQPRF